MPVPHKIIRGEGAGKWLPFACSKLAQLAAECEGARAPHRTRRFVVDAGMVGVEVAVKGGQHYIKIERRSCPKQLNGLADFVLQNTGQPGAPHLTPIYEVPDPNDPTQTINVFRRFYPSPATPAEDRAWRDDPRLAKSEEAAQQLRLLPASMFSGEMRKVVQILQGRNLVIPYAPVYSLTHGVFVGSSGQRWIIEVSNAGVFAWVMGMCRQPILDREGAELLPYTPISTPAPQGDALTAAIAAGTFRVLLDAPSVQPAFNKFRFFTDCGWAFSADGHNAVNVCWDWPGAYKKSYLYRLAIAETEEAPRATSMVAIEEGLIHGPRSTHMKYPETGFTNLFSFDPQYGDFSDTANADGPVYAYYNGNTPIIVRYGNFPASSPVTYNDPIPTILNSDLICESLFGKRLNVGTITTVNIVHFTSTEELGARASADNRASGTYDHVVTKLEDVGLSRQNCGGPLCDFQVFRAQTSRVAQSADSYTGRSVIIIPWGDRESFIYAEEVTYNFPATTYTQEYGYVHWISGRFLTQPVRFCPGAPGTAISEVATGALGEPLTYCADGSVQWRLRFAAPVAQVWPVTTGVEYQFKEDDAGVCAASLTPPLHLDTAVVTSNPADPRTEKTYTLRLYASGAAPRDLPQLTDVFHWNRIFEYTEDGSQNMAIFRDACDPAKFIMTPDINQFGGASWLSTAGQYPVSETGSVVRFVGVP